MKLKFIIEVLKIFIYIRLLQQQQKDSYRDSSAFNRLIQSQFFK